MSLSNSMHGESRGEKDPGRMSISQECWGTRSATSKSTAAVTFFPRRVLPDSNIPLQSRECLSITKVPDILTSRHLRWQDHFNSQRLAETVLGHALVITVYPKKYAHGYCFAVLCCGYTLTDFPISIRLTSLALWQSNDCPSASKATLMNIDKYFMWIHYERLHNHNKAKHNKTVCIFLGYTVHPCKQWSVFLHPYSISSGR